MATKVYGQSDDNIYIIGDRKLGEPYDQLGGYDYVREIAFDDGTVLTISYGKKDKGIWEICVNECGSLFDRFEECTDEDADIYSDIVYFKDGLKSFTDTIVY